ncbi:MAG TPA: isoprenylcysteine carboxylmethyltransferase family protein [Terriglobales bacterium]|nr:isoprenylcysteine carboxylmethyltransferase family protein [Terriglobales bacterium]
MSAARLRSLVAQTVILFAVLGLVLFGAAGTLAWAPGWTFVVLYLGFSVITLGWLVRHDPGLLEERMTPFRSGQPLWDRAFIILTGVLVVAWFVVMPLDAERLRWSHTSTWLQAAGALVLVASLVLFFLTFRENPYLSPAVRVQRERGQRVVSSGPYRYVRHPLYSGVGLFALGTPLLLGSWTGLLFGTVIVAMVAWRAVREERTLRDELDGYEEYLSRVRFRLIPGVW